MKKSFINSLLSLALVTFIGVPAMSYEAPASKALIAVAQVYHSSPEFAEILLQAQEEATAFSFSDGALRGPSLGNALQLIRSQSPGLHATDMDLAIAIVQAN